MIKIRIIGIDYGDARVGVAVSDETGFLASAVCTVNVSGMRDACKKVSEKIKELGGTKIVLGLPKNMDGTCGFQSEKVREFASLVLARFDGSHDFYDERLTTMRAERFLLEGNVRRDKRKKVIDKMAAAIILEGYLEQHRF